jgi:CubicO group peptidase (beta-lactamase class C family)
MSNANRRTTLKALAAGFLSPLLPGCAAPPTRPKEIARNDHGAVIEYLSTAIPHELAVANVTGLSIALLDDQRLVWAQGFGYADKALGIHATPRTRYRAGSISKVFTAAAAMQLAEAGKMDIDAPVVGVLPGFSIRSHDADAGAVTARMIMTHHSGLPSDRIEGMWTDQPAYFTSVVEDLRDEYRTFPANLVHAYSNVGFGVLGAAIEQVAGEPFERVLKERLLIPLGMKDSAFETAPPEGPLASLAYDAKGRPSRELPLRDMPAGGLNSTVSDLLQFARMAFAGGVLDSVRVLRQSSIEEMQRPQNSACALDADLRVGLGWHFAPSAVRGGGPVLFHDGGTMHHHSVLMLLPDHRLAVAVMANSANAMESVMTIASDALSLCLEVKTGIAQPDGEGVLPSDERYPAAPLDAFPGHYVTDLGYVAIRRDGTRLRVDAGDQTLAMTSRTNGYLSLEYRLLGLIAANLGKLGHYEFTRARIADREVLLARHDGGFYLAGEKIEPKAIPAAWMTRLGSYEYTGSDAFIASELGNIELKTEDSFLLVQIGNREGQQTLALEAIDNNRALVRGLGRARGDTVHVRGIGRDETLHYAGLAFTRKDTAGRREEPRS